MDFIADLGANHDGSLARALLLIRLAAESGATVVKFQHFRPAHIVSPEGFAALPPMAHQANWKESVVEVYRKAELPWHWTPALKEQCDRCGVEFMSTPYDLEAVDHLNPYVKRWKIGSGDITYRALLEKVAGTGKPVILSTGASTMPEVVKAHSILLASGASDVATLHCVTDYTGGPSGNLKVLRSGMFDGISDHTWGTNLIVAAVALGARIIERHFTDDVDRAGPDHAFAMTPAGWRAMVDTAHDTLVLLGDGQKRVMPNEVEARIVQRRCWRAARDLPPGHVIAPGDVEALRPCPEGAWTPIENPIGRPVYLGPIKKGEALVDPDRLTVVATCTAAAVMHPTHHIPCDDEPPGQDWPNTEGHWGQG